MATPIQLTPEERELRLADLFAFRREFVSASESGRDLRQVDRALDPDPLVYLYTEELALPVGRRLDAARELIAAAPRIPGFRRAAGLVVGGVRAGHPSVAAGPDGRILVTWIEWHPGSGEQVVAAVLSGIGDRPTPAVVSIGEADCHRPTAMFDALGRPWVFFGQGPAGRSTVRATRQEQPGGAWSAPEDVSGDLLPSLNQETAAHADGSIECAWQSMAGGRSHVYSRRWRDGRWGEILPISTGPGRAWDPSLVALPDGSTAYAWSAYADGAYRLVSCRDDGSGRLRERTLTSGTDYALHPSLAATPDGTVWCAFDEVTIQGHGGSGPTTLRHRSEVGRGRLLRRGVSGPGEYVPDDILTDSSARIRVLCLGAGATADPTAWPGEIAPGLSIGPAGLPRLAATPGGGLALAYRFLHRLPFCAYYWETAAQVLGPDGWSGPVTFEDSSGPFEEPTVASAAGGALVAWQTDHRRGRCLTQPEGFGGVDDLHLAAHFGGVLWDAFDDAGTICCAALPAEAPAPAPASLVPASGVSGVRVEARPWAATPSERYATTVGGRELSLYWGDLHRHSLVSRCNGGAEQSIDDFYRFARDVFEYDFWALTDHAEHSSAHQWWLTQKYADALLVPGHFVPLYGFEWTSTKGHQNVIFGDVVRGAPIYSSRTSFSSTPDQLWALLRQHPDFPAVTIPHHPGASGMSVDWDFFDPEYLRLVEIFQACRGNYEDDGGYRSYIDAGEPGMFTVDGLRRGYRFGLIASSDHGNGASYVGAYAPRLERDAVFDALHARRVIAATTRDIVLDVRIGDAFIGEEATVTGPIALDIVVEAYREIARVDIVRDGDVVHSIRPDLGLAARSIAVPLRVEWGGVGGRLVHGRLGVDGAAGILDTEYWSGYTTEATGSSLRWEARMPHLWNFGKTPRSAVECTITGDPDAVVSIDSSTGSVRRTLGELVRGPWPKVPGPDGGWLHVRPGTGGLVTLGTSRVVTTFVDEPSASAWYYVRAILVDGEMAWSSPIWIDRPEG